MPGAGPQFQFSEAISFIVHCDSQAEVDYYYWKQLGAGGDESAQACGWLKDRFGVSWQVVPTALYELLQDEDSKRSQRVMQAMLQMKKIEIPALERAHRGE